MRSLLELATTCFERGVLPETPLAGFAIYQAALLGVYAAHFGSSSGAAAVDADADAALCSPSGQVAVRRALELLAAMRHRLPLAAGWLRTLHRLHAFVGRARRPRKSEAGVVPEAAVIRDAGGGGGGGDELRLLDVLFAELGAPEDQLADTATATAMVTAAAVTANGDEPPPVKSEASDERRDAWVPVNGHQQQQQQQQQHRDGNSATLRPIEPDRAGSTSIAPTTTAPTLPSILNLPPASPPAYAVSCARPAPPHHTHPWPSPAPSAATSSSTSTSSSTPNTTTTRPPPPFSSLLPALLPAAHAHTPFPAPPLAAVQPAAQPPAPPQHLLHHHHHHHHHHHQHQHQHQHQHHQHHQLQLANAHARARLTPPESRAALSASPRVVSPRAVDAAGSVPPLAAAADDVRAFMEGEGLDTWAVRRGAAAGWLGVLWEGAVVR
ncbi:hypothetical protein LOZ57_006533 [Ophidiomyces ophidiicola]|uniref:uncharacterized protein n=1 Tax=Ophidiomyces ophidiicola TaxID=1387563 RepID=UPI0020C53D31|nr:uncharacterized protein LOZ57_006533 [Ophidiomyces ophidiicola]KAI1937852.1 hypothetical protein LOZ57_006533 [Ophidiomyces ophidiicola]